MHRVEVIDKIVNIADWASYLIRIKVQIFNGVPVSGTNLCIVINQVDSIDETIGAFK